MQFHLLVDRFHLKLWSKKEGDALVNCKKEEFD